jgi:hypothetical protein
VLVASKDVVILQMVSALAMKAGLGPSVIKVGFYSKILKKIKIKRNTVPQAQFLSSLKHHVVLPWYTLSYNPVDTVYRQLSLSYHT